MPQPTTIWTSCSVVMVMAMPFGTLTLQEVSHHQQRQPTARSPHGPECEVGVHQRVDEVVHDHEPARAGGELAEAVEHVDQYRQVVIPDTGLWLYMVSTGGH